MIKFNIAYIFMLCCLLTACNKNDNFLVEENPASNIIDIDGHDFIIKGNIDGEEFVIKHESNEQYNSPINSSGIPFFGTSFSIKNPKGGGYESHIFFGLTTNAASTFNDIFHEGEYSWYNHSVPSQSIGEAFINQFIFEEDNMTNSTSPEINPNNYFEISSITPLELDKNLEKIYSGKLYKVEGHFAIDMDKWDNSNEVPRLTVEYFSAIFYDE